MSSRVKWGPKDPDAERIYGNDWTGDIGDETIVTSIWLLDGVAWPVSPELELVASSIIAGGKKTAIRLAGGVLGKSYRVTNHVVLSNGEIDDWTEALRIRER